VVAGGKRQAVLDRGGSDKCVGQADARTPANSTGSFGDEPCWYVFDCGALGAV